MVSISVRAKRTFEEAASSVPHGSFLRLACRCATTEKYPNRKKRIVEVKCDIISNLQSCRVPAIGLSELLPMPRVELTSQTVHVM